MSDSSAYGLTDCARQILDQIPRRAWARGLFRADESTARTLYLWALIRWERKLGLVALEQMKVDLHSLADALDARLCGIAANVHADIAKGPIWASTGKPVEFEWSTDHSPAEFEILVQQAQSEAQQMGHDYIGSEHLLLAVIRLADLELGQILSKHRVAYDHTRHMILSILGQA